MTPLRLVIVIALVASACTACVSTVPAPAATHPKKCRAKCLRKKARHFIAGHTYSYTWFSDRLGGGFNAVDLCRDGMLHFREDNAGFDYEYHDTYDGTWAVTKAGRLSVQVAVTTANYQVTVDFNPTTSAKYATPPPLTATPTFPLDELEPVMWLSGRPLTRGPGSC